MGMDNEEILDYFYEHSEIVLEDNNYVSIPYNFEDLKGELSFNLVDANSKKFI